MEELVDFPYKLESPQTLEYIGFNISTAQSIWQAWTSTPILERDLLIQLLIIIRSSEYFGRIQLP